MKKLTPKEMDVLSMTSGSGPAPAGMDDAAGEKDSASAWILKDEGDDILFRGGGNSSGITVRKKFIYLRFLSVDGSIKTRRARLFLPGELRKAAPVIISVHYEMPPTDPSLFDYLAAGWAVLTPVDIPFADLCNIVDDDFRFSSAILSAVRRWNFVDGQRIAIKGASAGGYQALLLSALRLGVCAAYDMSGVCNMPYEFGRYIPESNRHNLAMEHTLSEEQRKDFNNYLIPFVKTVADTFEATRIALGAEDPADLRWLTYSPVNHLDKINQPLLLSHSTADAIVPIYQVTESGAYGTAGKDLPEGYRIHLRDLTPFEGAGRPLDELAAPAGLSVYRLAPPVPGQCNILRFDPEKLFSLNIIDEGQMERACSHFKSVENGLVSDMGFFSDHLARGAAATNRLPWAKLEELARRYRGECVLFAMENPCKTACEPGVFGSLASDRLDVLLELLAYLGLQAGSGGGRLCRENLQTLESAYQRLGTGFRFLDEAPSQPADAGLPGKILSLTQRYAAACSEEAVLSAVPHMRSIGGNP